MKRLYALFCIYVLLLPANVAAHVFVPDTRGKTGMVMHIVPDDDPVAGESSTVYADFKGGITTSEYEYELTATKSDWESKVPMRVTGDTSLAADITFPAQGNYRLTIAAAPKSGGESLLFVYSQAVNRGAFGSPLDRPTYVWAELLTVVTACAIVLVTLVVLARRRQISAFTK